MEFCEFWEEKKKWPYLFQVCQDNKELLLFTCKILKQPAPASNSQESETQRPWAGVPRSWRGAAGRDGETQEEKASSQTQHFLQEEFGPVPGMWVEPSSVEREVNSCLPQSF